MSATQALNEERMLGHARALADCTSRHDFVVEARGFLERVVGADASMWFPWDRDDPHFMGAVWPSIAADVQLAYTSGLFRDDPIYRWIQDDPTATSSCVTTLRDLSARGCVLSPAWQERCYQPCSIGDILCIAHLRQGRIVGNFSLHRMGSARPFSARPPARGGLQRHAGRTIVVSSPSHGRCGFSATHTARTDDREPGERRAGIQGDCEAHGLEPQNRRQSPELGLRETGHFGSCGSCPVLLAAHGLVTTFLAPALRLPACRR